MKKSLVVVITLFFVCIQLNSHAQIKLPRLIRDSMILQREVPTHVWGWAAANEKIKIEFKKQTFTTKADANGNWKLSLPATPAGGPYTLVFKGTNTIVLKEILFGDVFICSGQSNMVHQVELHSVRYADEVEKANYPQIRHFLIPNLMDTQKPHEDVSTGFWKAANPKDVLQFSAVAYFFAKNIYEQYHIPIGLINASVGGTPIEAWTSEEGLQNLDSAYVNNLKRAVVVNNPPFSFIDKGMQEKWFEAKYHPKNWHTITVPGYWEDQGVKDFDGVMWYRKEIQVPTSMAGQAARLFLGRIVDADYVYVNDQQIGNTTYMYPQRRYQVPAGLLHEGKNTIVVRVQNFNGKGGFVPDKPYYLFSGKDTIDLKGDWTYKVGAVFNPENNLPNAGAVNAYKPASLYNAMIAPIINYTSKGFIWYQGESNTGRASAYEKLQVNLINDWRAKWQQGNTPFIYVQLPGFLDMNYLPTESQWAVLREGQMKALSTPNTAMTIAIDLGEWNDVHPDRKKDVSDRIALAARNIIYQEKNIEYSGPLFENATIENNKITISFTHTGTGLTSNDGEALSYFSIAGSDKKFVWAKAVIMDNKVIVSSPLVPNPKYVRYAWSDNPDGANLYNKEGLPAAPFRTDQ